MGGKQSRLKGGAKNVQAVDFSDIQNKLQEIMDSVLIKHRSEITNKSYCKRLKMFITNDVLMKYSTDTLQKVSKNIFIGIEQDDSKENIQLKETICKRLTNLYIRKLNLIASIHIMLDICYKRIYAMKKGNRCISKDNPFRVSSISVLESDNLKEIENNKYSEKSEQKDILDELAETSSQSGGTKKDTDTIGVTKQLLRDKGIDSIKLKYKERDIDDSAKDYVFVSELFDEKTCVSQKGEWIDSKSDLVKLKLKPSPELKEYNKKWKRLMQEMENKFNEEALQLLLICDTLVEERITTDKDGKTTKSYVDKEIDEKLLDELIRKTKPKLIFLYSYINDRYLTMTTVPIISQEDVDRGNEIKRKYEEMTRKLHSS